MDGLETTSLTTRADQKKTGTPAKRMRIGKTHEQTIKSGSNTHAQELLPAAAARRLLREGRSASWWDEEFSLPSFSHTVRARCLVCDCLSAYMSRMMLSMLY
jgi:hypothetical protein